MSQAKTINHRALNHSQLKVLELLAGFRFCSADQFAQIFNKPGADFVKKRLAILAAQGYIGKHFLPSYRLQAKPAAYYLLPKGARALKASGSSRIDDRLMKNLYTITAKTENFIDHCLLMVAISNQLRYLFGQQLDYYVQNSLQDWSGMPSWPPDAYLDLRVGASSSRKQPYFLDVFDSATPFFVMARRVNYYLKFQEAGTWQLENGSPLPTCLMVCLNARLQTRLYQWVIKATALAYPSIINFGLTTTEQLLTASTASAAIWQSANHPAKTYSLESLVKTV